MSSRHRIRLAGKFPKAVELAVVSRGRFCIPDRMLRDGSCRVAIRPRTDVPPRTRPGRIRTPAQNAGVVPRRVDAATSPRDSG
jgi:hypothetical protein